MTIWATVVALLLGGLGLYGVWGGSKSDRAHILDGVGGEPPQMARPTVPAPPSTLPPTDPTGN